jgi:hypothetical protein
VWGSGFGGCGHLLLDRIRVVGEILVVLFDHLHRNLDFGF